MKKSKFILGVVAAFSMIVAMTGCDLAVREKVTFSDGLVVTTADTPAASITQSMLDFETSMPSLVATTEGEKCINLSAASSSGAAGAVNNALAHWQNPLFGKDIKTNGATITFDAYTNATGTYSGFMGFYDSTTGGFIWLTNTYLMWNTTANAEGSTCTFSYADPAGANYQIDLGLADQKWQSFALVIKPEELKMYVDGALVNKVTASANGTTMEALLEFLEGYCDVIAAGAGCVFWDNGGFGGSYVKNINVYDSALNSAQLGSVLEQPVTENVSYNDFEAALIKLGEANNLTDILIDYLIAVNNGVSSSEFFASLSTELKASFLAAIAEHGISPSALGLPLTDVITGNGSVSSPFILSASSISETINGKENAIDAYNYQSSTSHDVSAPIIWNNPLKNIDVSATGLTLSMDIYNLPADSVNGFDALFTLFTTPNTEASATYGIYEGGAVHLNDWAGNYGDSVDGLAAGSWTKITLVINPDGTVVRYVGTSAYEITLTGDGTTLLQNMAASDYAAIGVGGIWPAGYVDQGAAVANIKIYSTALTAAQVGSIQ